MRSSITAGLLACLLAAPPALGAEPAARQEIVRTETRTVAITGNPTLDINHGSGYVRIRTHQRQEVQIDASIRVSAKSRATAVQFADGMELAVAATGPAITIRFNKPTWSARNDDVGFAIDLDVLVPERMPIRVQNRFGDTTVTGVAGPATLVSGNGRLTTADGKGRYQLKNLFGSIDVQRHQGDLDIESDNGPVAVGAMTGGLTVISRFSDVMTRDVGGPVNIKSLNGSVSVGLAGGRPCHDVSIETTFGNVDVFVDGGYSFTASTTFGSIRTEVPVKTSGTLVDRNRTSTVSGTIADGGCQLRIAGRNGDVSLKPGPAPALAEPSDSSPRAPRAPRADRGR